jgi:NADPH-dependent ferric siderophore reductase
MLSPWLTRVTLAGPELGGLTVDQPAASVRLLLPSPADPELVIPSWNGNEFLLGDGRRPHIRTLTPRRLGPAARELDVDIVIHGGGVASDWVTTAAPGDPVAISGPGRGYVIEAAPTLLLAGDETAIPAISQLLEAAPAGMAIRVHIEAAHADARLVLPRHARATVAWHDRPPASRPGDALVDAVRGTDIDADTRIWVAGEAAAVQRIRRYLFEERGFSRSQATVRGYWKYGRGGDPADEVS